MAQGKSKRSKKPDGRPARKRYWAANHLQRNKIRNILRYNWVYDDPNLTERTKKVVDKDGNARMVKAMVFVCPKCKKQMTMAQIRYHCGRCATKKCKQRVHSRRLTETEAKDLWRDSRKRHVA